MMKKKPLLFFDYIKGFWKAKMAKTPLLVTYEQAKFIRKYRLQKMKEKLFLVKTHNLCLFLTLFKDL